MLFSRRSRQRRPDSQAAAPERVLLRFADGPGEEDVPQEDLSAVAVTGGAIWLAGDEGTSLERLVREPDGSFGARTRFRLSDLVDLPGAADEEVDLEGIDVADGWLWVVGSHASARRKADPSAGDAAAQLERLATVRAGSNRHLLARIPVVQGDDGHAALARTAPGADGGAPRRAARLRGGRRRSALTRALRDDAHLGPSRPCRRRRTDSTSRGSPWWARRLFLGLRGPVLRGMAVILEVEPRPAKRRPSGSGSRASARMGGATASTSSTCVGWACATCASTATTCSSSPAPTMTLDGRCVVFRWPGAAAAAREGAARAAGGGDAARDDTLVGDDVLQVALELPYGVGADESLEHPEGIAFVPDDAGRRALLVVHDAPAEHRKRGAHEIEADLYRLH
jgi:hypothetical protein